MKNWQKVVTAMLLLIVKTSYASWQGNWLLGVSGGWADRRGEVDITTIYTAVPFFAQTQWDERYSDEGIIWGALAGYQIKKDGWIWGAEVHIESQHIGESQAFVFPDVNSARSWGVINRYSLNAIYGISGRMAYEMAPYFIPYLRLGAEGSQDTLNTTISGAPIVFPFSIDLHDKQLVYRYLVGVGAETPLFCSRASLRLEYDYHSRGRALGATATISAFPTPLFFTEMHPRAQSFKLSLVWNFT